jgi:hypothetical protein
MPTDLPFLPPDKSHRSLIFTLLNVFHFFLFMSTTSYTLLTDSAFTTSLYCNTHFVHQSPSWLSLAWWVVHRQCSLRRFRHQVCRRGACSPGSPAGVPSWSGAFSPGAQALHCGQLGRWSGAEVSRVLTLRNLCGTPTTTVFPTTTSQYRPTRTGGFQDQAGLVSFGLVVAALWGLCRWWFLLIKGDHGRPLFLPRPLPNPGTS